MKVETIDAQVVERCISTKGPDDKESNIGVCRQHSEEIRRCHDLRLDLALPDKAEADLCFVSTAIIKTCTKHRQMIRECAGLEIVNHES